MEISVKDQGIALLNSAIKKEQAAVVLIYDFDTDDSDGDGGFRVTDLEILSSQETGTTTQLLMHALTMNLQGEDDDRVDVVKKVIKVN